MHQFKEMMPELASEYRKNVDPGDGFQPMKEIIKLFVNEEQTSLEHKPGEVLLVVFWMKE
jgi:hypothetical protein